MPAQERSHRKQKALVWDFMGADDKGLPAVSATFREIKVRWNDESKQSTDRQGNVISTDGDLILGERIEPGSVMWKGSQEDLWDSLPGTSRSTSDVPLSGIVEVITMDVTEDVRGRQDEFEATFRRKGNKMPTRV